MNLGSAVAARMPRIRITTTSSIRVKPWYLDFICLSFRKVENIHKSRRVSRSDGPTTILLASAGGGHGTDDRRGVECGRLRVSNPAIRRSATDSVYRQRRRTLRDGHLVAGWVQLQRGDNTGVGRGRVAVDLIDQYALHRDRRRCYAVGGDRLRVCESGRRTHATE